MTSCCDVRHDAMTSHCGVDRRVGGQMADCKVGKECNRAVAALRIRWCDRLPRRHSIPGTQWPPQNMDLQQYVPNPLQLDCTGLFNGSHCTQPLVTEGPGKSEDTASVTCYFFCLFLLFFLLLYSSSYFLLLLPIFSYFLLLSE